MNKRFLAVAALATALAAPALAQKACTKSDETGAQKAIDRITSWPNLNATWRTYRHCDAGAVGELFTDAILRLVIDWKGVTQLADAMRDPDYKDFILKHLGSPEAKGDAPDVYSRAKANCPKGLEDFCKEIAAAVKEGPPPAADLPMPLPMPMPSIRPQAAPPKDEKK